MIPYIPQPQTPSADEVPATQEEFTVGDGLAWLGISLETYERSGEILRGRHGNPIGSALLDARAAQGTDTTPAQVLAKHDIDPADPLKAVRAYDRGRRWLDNPEADEDLDA